MSLKRRKNSPYWWCRFKVAGKEHFKSTGTTVRREAQIFERKYRAELEEKAARGTASQGVKGATLHQVGGLDLARAFRENVDPYTIKTYHEVHWKHFAAFFGGDVNVATITSRRVIDYVDHRRELVRVQTIRKELATLKRGLTLAYKRGWLESVPVDWPSFVKSDIPDKKQSGKIRDPALVNEWLALMSSSRRQPARDVALFAVMTGLRWKELRRIRPEWVERMPEDFPVPAILRLRPEATKGRYERVVGLTPEALAIVDRAMARLELRRERQVLREVPEGKRAHKLYDGTLFGPNDPKTTYQKASKVLIEAGKTETNITLRDLRHTHASLALASGTDIKALMASMGHKDLAIAARYQSSTLARTAAAVAGVAAQIAVQGGASKVEHKPRGRRK